MNIAQAAPLRSRTRVSSESAWPLRGVDGLTFAQRRASRASPVRDETRRGSVGRQADSTRSGEAGGAQPLPSKDSI